MVHDDAFSAVLNVPLAQGLQTGRELVPPVATNEPALQLHTLSCVEVPAPVCVCPVGHDVKGVQAVAPALVLKVPSAHVRQSVSLVDVPPAAWNCPATHCVKGWHIAALVVVVKPPLHVAHWRSAVAVPAVCTNWPATQVVYGVHVLSVLLVPATEMKLVVPHDIHAAHAVALADALNVPVAQVVHCRSAVVEPDAVGEM